VSEPLPQADAPEDLGLEPEAVRRLVGMLQRYVREGEIPSGQLAVARHGKVALCATFGSATRAGRTFDADDDTLYLAFSTTKAVTSAALWLLAQDGKIAFDDFVSQYVPEFAANGKESIRVENLLTHTAGFPSAKFDPLEWDDPERRRSRFASWTVEWEPGSRFEYHPASSMWVVAELIERISGTGFREFVRVRIAEPLRLPALHLGLPEDHPGDVADVVEVGSQPDPAALAASGLAISEQFTGAGADVLRFNRPEVRAVGVPGGGLVTNARTLALFYQGLLHGGTGGDTPHVWQPETLREARRVRTGDLVDPMTRRKAHRGLGVVVSGDAERIFRSFAAKNSPDAFGHAGLGGQLAWADPATGISFAFLTNGCDRDLVKMGSRGISLASAAVACVDTGGDDEQGR